MTTQQPHGEDGRALYSLLVPLEQMRLIVPGYFGILTAGFPQLVRVSAEVLVADDESNWPASAPVLCQLRMVGQSPVIPDLELLEHQLAESA